MLIVVGGGPLAARGAAEGLPRRAEARLRDYIEAAQ